MICLFIAGLFARFETSRSTASSTKFATTLVPPYETNGSVMPGQRDDAQDAADDDEGLQREAEREAGREQLREAVLRLQRDAHAADDEDHEDEEQRGRADQAELLRDRGEDEVGAEVRDELRAVDRGERALTEPGSPEAAVRDRVEALDELVRGAVLPVLELPVERAVHALVGPRVQPDRDAILDVVDARCRGRRRPPTNRASPAATNSARAGRDVEHREEDPEVEERAAEVVRLDDHEHRRAPDRDERAEVLQASLREHLALLAQVAGEEEDQADLRELAGLELERPDAHPQPHAVHALAEAGHRGQQEQRDGSDAEEVAVRLEDAVVVPERR